MLNWFLLERGDVCFPGRRGLCFGEPTDAAPISQSEEGLELWSNIGVF